MAVIEIKGKKYVLLQSKIDKDDKFTVYNPNKLSDIKNNRVWTCSEVSDGKITYHDGQCEREYPIEWCTRIIELHSENELNERIKDLTPEQTEKVLAFLNTI